MKHALTLALLIPAAVAAGWWVRGVIDPFVQASDAPAYIAKIEAHEAKLVAEEEEMMAAGDVMADDTSGVPRRFADRLALMDSIGENPSMENIKAALETLLSMRSSELRRALQEIENEHARRLIIDRWVEMDSKGVLNFINSSDDREYRLVRELMTHWSKTDPKRAIAAVADMPEKMQSYAYQRLVDYMAEDEPEMILELIQSGKMGDNVGSRYYRLMAKWGEKDPEAAFAMISSLPEKSQTIAYRGYFDGLVQIDPHLALSQAESVSQNFSQRKEILASLYADWMELDMDAAFESLAEIPSGSLRGNLIRRFAYDMPRDDPEKLMGLIGEHTDGRWERDIIRGFMQDMARVNPAKTAELIDAMPFGSAYNDSVYRLMDSWADDDPVAALSWAQTLPPGQEKFRAIGEGLQEFARLDPDQAFAYYQSLPPNEQDPQISHRLITGLADDPIRGFELIAGIEDDELYHDMQTRLISSWVSNDPEAAIAFTQDYEIDIGPRAGSIASTWSRRDPKAAFDWAMTLEDENRQRDAISNVARNWVSHNSLEASKAIAAMPVGEVQDAAIRNLVDKMRHREPAAAFDWALGMSDENQRRDMVQRSLSSWKDRDPEAAAYALRQSDLPVEQINQIRTSLDLE